jgi:hypothetical protein
MAQRKKVTPSTKISDKGAGIYIEKNLATFLQLLLSLIAAIIFLVGGRLAFDAQYRWAGIFMCAGGVGCSALTAFIHHRHLLLKKKMAAVSSLLAFTAFIVGMTVLGLSQWWFKATKDSDSFNAIAVTSLIADTSQAPDKVPPLVTIAFTPGDTIIHPVSMLLYMRVTNKQSTPAVLNGISLEISSNGWWKTWQRLCPVDLHASQLAWININQSGEATLFGADQNLEPKLMDKQLAPFETVSGWIAWECPKNALCAPEVLRIGLSDAAGSVSWQHVPSPVNLDIGSTLNAPGLRTAGRINILDSPRRVMRSCRM